MNINVQRNSTSRSYSSDAPLVKVSREQTPQREEYIKEYVPAKQKTQVTSTEAKERTSPSNYSANRRF